MVKKLNEKNTKVQIIEAYEELAREKLALKSQLDKLQKETISGTKDKPKLEEKTAMNQP